MTLRCYQNHTPQLGKDTFVDASAVVTGKVTLGDAASVWPCVSIRGDLEAIAIGARSNIQDGSVLHTTHSNEFYKACPLTIGDDVTVGHNVTLHGCTLENLCLIGMNTVILDNATVQSNVFVGAGSLVPPGKVLESGYLYVGNPVRQARPLTDKEKAFLKYSAEHYVKLAAKHNPHSSQG